MRRKLRVLSTKRVAADESLRRGLKNGFGGMKEMAEGIQPAGGR